jgi:threonine 3-dehydrogenase
LQAVVKLSPGPGAAWATAPERQPLEGEALLQLVVAGICGTDLHILKWNAWAAARVHPPRILGHEMAGLVLAVGEGVQSPHVGDLVGVESHLVDLTCPQCRRGDYQVCENTRILGVDVDGVFAERVIVPARNCRVAPPSLDPAVVAFQEPMGNAVHAAAQGDLQGQVVMVTGCGPIGCAAVGIARAEGARRVVAVDRVPARLQIAEKMGADALVDTSSLPDLVRGLRAACRGEADVVLEMSGHPLLIQGALATIRPGGWISLLGLGDGDLTLDVSTEVVMRGITLFGVTGRRQFETWDQTSAYLSSGRVDVSPILTHRVALSDFQLAADLAGSGEVGKVVLYPRDGGWR